MSLDIRLPMGMLFTVLGVLLTGYGAFSDRAIYQKSLGMNLNLTWGLVILAFGLVMLVLGRRGTSSVRTADASPEGRATERREHETGIESDTQR